MAVSNLINFSSFYKYIKRVRGDAELPIMEDIERRSPLVYCSRETEEVELVKEGGVMRRRY